MRNSVNSLLGALSLAPAIGTAAVGALILTGASPSGFSAIAPLLLLSAAFVATQVVFVFLAVQSKSLPVAEKVAWIAGLLSVGPVIAPVFWFHNVRSGRLL